MKNVSTTVSPPAALLALLAFQSIGSDLTGVPIAKEEWQTNTYTEVGLKIQLPQWKADIKDQQTRWSLLAYPVSKDSNPGNRYRLQLSVDKLPLEEYANLSKMYGTNAPDHWGKSAHPQTSQRSNQFWIVLRRDVCGTNGFVYRCDGAVQRFPRREPERLKAIGGKDEELATEITRIFDTIEVVYEKPTTMR